MAGRPKKSEVSIPQGDTVETTSVPLAEEEHFETVAEAPKGPRYTVENQAQYDTVQGKRLPQVRAGVCEHCGPGQYQRGTSPLKMVEDWTVVPETQMGRCEHYKGIRIRCVYCKPSSDWAHNIRVRSHTIWEHSKEPGTIIICCDDMNCRAEHHKRLARKQ